MPRTVQTTSLFILLGAAGCVGTLGSKPPCDNVGDETECSEYGTSNEELRISGAWQPDPEALRISNGWTAGYDDAPAWNPALCSGGITPGGEKLRADLRARFPGIASIGGYSCRPNTGAPSRMSVHGTGRALDITVPTIAGDADNTVGDEIAHWLMVNSRTIGVQLIIWDRTVWNASRSPGSRVRAYTGPHPHGDHLHVEITAAAGRLETGYFGGGVTVESAPTVEAPPLVDHPDPREPCGALLPDEHLDHDDSVSSCDGRFLFVHQADGNVVLYGDGRALWASGTSGRASSFLVMQSDGNLVLYDRFIRPLWSSGTAGNPGARLAVQDDGNAVVYSGSSALWATGTAVASAPPPAPPPSPSSSCGALAPGEALGRGDSVPSCNGSYRLVHQTDGNVVLYAGDTALWATHTHGRSTSTFVMQTDGNLVLYGSDSALWASGTHGHAGAMLAVQDDANLVVYAPGPRAVWASGTNR